MVLFYLSDPHNTTIMEGVRRELGFIDPSDESILHLDLYNRVNMETLRKAGSHKVDGLKPRQLTSESPTVEVNNVIIPKGTVLNTNIMSLNHHPNFWKSPLGFNPDHFLKDNVAKQYISLIILETDTHLLLLGAEEGHVSAMLFSSRWLRLRLLQFFKNFKVLSSFVMIKVLALTRILF